MAKKTQTVHSAYGEASAAEVFDILEAAYQASMPVLLIGAPGVGKSALLRTYSVEHGRGNPIVLLLSTMDPTDMSGLPTRGHTERDGHTVPLTEYGMPWWQDCLIKGHYPDNKVCKTLFIDELTNCPPALQSSALELINNRILPCGEKLPDDVQIVMAANPESSATDYSPLASPMVNRILQVSYKPTDNEVYEGLTGGWFSEEEQQAWSPEERSWRYRIVEFLKNDHGTYILKENHIADGAIESTAPAGMNPEAENSDSEREILQSAWASPRSWDNVARVLAHTGYEREVTPIQERILAGTVGREATVFLIDYVHEHAQINPYELIRNPEAQNWRVNSTSGETYNDVLALAAAINAAVPKCDGKEGRPTVSEALDFYDKVIDLGGGAYFMTDYCQNTEGVGHYFKECYPEGIERRDWVRRINNILVKFKDAGLIPDGNAR